MGCGPKVLGLGMTQANFSLGILTLNTSMSIYFSLSLSKIINVELRRCTEYCIKRSTSSMGFHQVWFWDLSPFSYWLCICDMYVIWFNVCHSLFPLLKKRYKERKTLYMTQCYNFKWLKNLTGKWYVVENTLNFVFVVQTNVTYLLSVKS